MDSVSSSFDREIRTRTGGAIEGYDEKVPIEHDTAEESSENPRHLSHSLPLTQPENDETADFNDSTSEDDASSSENEDEPGYDMWERRQANIRKNHERLVELGLGTMSDLMGNENELEEFEDDPKTQVGSPGMLSPTAWNMPNASSTTADMDWVTEATEKFPGRQMQIQLLYSLLDATVSQTLLSSPNPFVPAPILVTGPSGTGKTSIVVDLCTHFRDRKSSVTVGCAYVNCSTLSPSSINTVLEKAYAEITSSFEAGGRDHQHRQRKRKGGRTKGTIPAKRLRGDTIEISDKNQKPSIAYTRQAPKENRDFNTEDNNTVPENPSKNQKRPSFGDQRKHEPTVRENLPREAKIQGIVPLAQSPATISTAAIMNKKKTDSISRDVNPGTAPVGFGKTLLSAMRTILDPESPECPKCGILVLDEAERLLTLAPKRSASKIRTNFLSQLLLLPRAIQLNLTVIVITKGILLMNTRINNPAGIDQASGIIGNGVDPIRVHFPAYSNDIAIRSILKTPHNLRMIVGDSLSQLQSSKTDARTRFETSLLRSFIDTLVQSVGDSSNDVRHFVLTGRHLWRKYTEPLHSDKISTTMQTVRSRLGPHVDLNGAVVSSDDIQRELMKYLDERAFQILRKWPDIGSFHHLFDGSTEDSILVARGVHSPTYITKCLLLAAFICQHNKPNTDKQLFTIQKNGKRRYRHGNSLREGDPESLAYGDTTWEQERLKMLRPRSFVLERMLSVFVSIVGLDDSPNKASTGLGQSDQDIGDMLRSMGSAVFFEVVSQLRDAGFLREVSGPPISCDDGTIDGINMGSTLYCCDLSKDDAMVLAQSIGFPLHQYLI